MLVFSYNSYMSIILTLPMIFNFASLSLSFYFSFLSLISFPSLSLTIFLPSHS